MWLYHKIQELFVLRSMVRGTAEPLAVTLIKAFGYAFVYFFFVGMFLYFIIIPIVRGVAKSFKEGGVKSAIVFIYEGIRKYLGKFLLLCYGFGCFMSEKKKHFFKYLNKFPKFKKILFVTFTTSFGIFLFLIGCWVLQISPVTRWIFYPAPEQVEVITYRYETEYVQIPCECCSCNPCECNFVPEKLTFQPRIVLSDTDRSEVEAIVCGEAGNQSFKGKQLVAQCIWNAMYIEGYSVKQVRSAFGYEGYCPLDQWIGATEEQKEEIRECVRSIFDREEFPVNAEILYFYSTAKGVRPDCWHETQQFIIWEDDHRFFARWN